MLYCTSGQKTEGEMLNNEHGSESFERFLHLLGDNIE